MKPIISIHWETTEEHQKTHHVLPVSDFLALSRQCTSILVTDAFERRVTQVPDEGAPMTRGGFVRVRMGCERGLSRI
jgi:hypothetical protein